jgi:hypothetical protein
MAIALLKSNAFHFLVKNNKIALSTATVVALYPVGNKRVRDCFSI